MSSKLPPFLPLEFGKCLKGRTNHLFHLSLCFFLLGSWPLKCCFSQPKSSAGSPPSATALCVGRLRTPSLAPVTGMQSAGGECAGEVVPCPTAAPSWNLRPPVCVASVALRFLQADLKTVCGSSHCERWGGQAAGRGRREPASSSRVPHLDAQALLCFSCLLHGSPPRAMSRASCVFS